MRELITTLFGEYTPLMDPQTGSAVLGVAGCDWEWIAGVFLFGIVLFCFLRMVGVLLKNG